VCAVLSSVCTTTVDNSGVYVYYLKGIVSVCFRCPARTVGFSGGRNSTLRSLLDHSLWQSIVIFSTELHGTSPTTVCQSPKFLVASICDLPDVINCQFREFAVAPLGPVPFLLLDQQSEFHCLIKSRIQLLTPNNSDGSWRCICSPDIRSISAFRCLRNRALQIDIYHLLTYLTFAQRSCNLP